MTTWWQDFYGDIDNQRLDSLEKRLADDVVVTMAGNPPVTGVSDVIEGQRKFFTMFRSLRHNFVKTWELNDDAILEAVVTYVRHDGDAVEVPCTTILHRANDLVDSVRIYLDLTPLFAAAQAGQGST